MTAPTKHEPERKRKTMKRCLIGLAYAFLLSGGTEVLAEINDDPPSHCKGNPTEGTIPATAYDWTIFACRIGEKTLSLCGHMNKDRSGFETMSYHYGLLGQPPEFEYPKRPVPVWKAFKVSGLNIHRRPLTAGFTEGPIEGYRNKAAADFEKTTDMVLPSGAYTEMAFSSGPYTYTFYYQIAGSRTPRGLPGEPENTGEGLVVEKAGEIIAHLPCSESWDDVNSGAEGRSFAYRIDVLIKGLYAKDNFKDEAKYFRGVSPLNQRFRRVATNKGD